MKKPHRNRQLALIVLTLLYSQAPLFAQRTPNMDPTSEAIEAGRDGNGGGGYGGDGDASGVGSEAQGYAQTAHGFIDSMEKGEFEKTMSYLDDTMKSAVSPDKLKTIWQQLGGASGTNKEPQRKRLLTDWQESQNGHTSVFIPRQFGDTILNLVVVFSGSNKIAGFFVRPHLDEAPYVKRDKFKELEVKVGTGKWQNDGTLSLPAGRGPFPAVILVHGSGPLDKDSTIGPNKPFQDLAYGLASQGVAVLRYEKRTKQHKADFSPADLKSFTVKEETIDDAIEAIKTLLNNSQIDSSNIFLLGHSLGGMLIPRIAAQDKSFKGFISLAGSNTPIEEAIVKQAEFLASQSPGEDESKMLNALKKQSAQIKNFTESDVATGPMLLGAYPAYYLDLRAHNPIAEVNNLDRPVLFLQGGRDYQVTSDDFTRWKTAIKKSGKDNLCQFKLYPELNHFFMAGIGKSTGKEYFETPAHVDERVIADIAEWIHKQSGPKSQSARPPG